jgi:hypothetical protein
MSLPFFAAIDPLFLIFPEKIAIILAEKLHPHTLSVGDIQKALQGLSPEERAAVGRRAQVLGAYAKATTEALGSVAAKAGSRE